MAPEHLHLLVNHIPIHGLAFSSLCLLIGLALRNDKVVVTGLALVMLASLSIPLVMGTGEAALHRFEADPAGAERIDGAGLQWAKKHYEDAEKGAKATYLLILASGACLAFARWKTKWLGVGAWIVLALAAMCLVLNMWIASSGGTVRRPDFRLSADVEASD